MIVWEGYMAKTKLAVFVEELQHQIAHLEDEKAALKDRHVVGINTLDGQIDALIKARDLAVEIFRRRSAGGDGDVN